MSQSFTTIIQFLEQFGPEVEGRARQDPPEEMQIKLKAFARGNLAASEMDHVLDQLKANPEWIPFLAEEIKALRAEDRKGNNTK